MKNESDFRYQFAAQISSLSRRIYKKWGVGLEELRKLETIYLVCLDKTEIISKVNEEQQELLERKDTIWQKCWYVSQSDFFVAGQRSAGVLTGARTTWNGCGNIWN